MENSKEIQGKLDQLIEMNLKQLVFSMFTNGHTMNEIAKNLHLGKQTVVKMLDGIQKKK